MRERLTAALRKVQLAKSEIELCVREASEDSQAPQRLSGTLTEVVGNLRVSEMYLIRVLGRLPAEPGDRL
jgi:hypothetical protein